MNVIYYSVLNWVILCINFREFYFCIEILKRDN